MRRHYVAYGFATACAMPCFYLTPKQDDFNQELQICIAEVLYDVDSIVADPGAYTKEQLATLHTQIVSNLERVWEITGGSEDQLTGTMKYRPNLLKFQRRPSVCG